MEDEEMNFDAVVAAPQPSGRKLSRLKRAGLSELEKGSNKVAAASPTQQQGTALQDMTNTLLASSDASQHMAAVSQASSDASTGKAVSEPQSPESVRASPAHSRGEQQDYWDSEDELEAELTKRERAEGFHAGSPSASERHSGPADDSDSGASQHAAEGSQGGYEELNSQTQRLLRDSAKRDTLGHGQSISRLPLTGILGKIAQRKDAIAMRAPAVPVRPRVQKKLLPVPPKTQMDSNANKHGSTEAGEDDLLLLSDDEEQEETEAKQVSSSKGPAQAHGDKANLGTRASMPFEDTQEMNFDSIAFEEPELFRARSGLRPALKSLAKDCASLDLQLDSQPPENSLDKQDQAVEANFAERSKPADQPVSYQQDTDHAATPDSIQEARPVNQDVSSEGHDSASGKCGVEDKGDNEEEGDDAEDEEGSAQLSGTSDEEEGDEEEDEAANSEADASEASSSQADNGNANEAASAEEAASADQAEASSQPDFAPAAGAGHSLPDKEAWWHAARKKQKQPKQAVPMRNEFVDEEAEMSEDEGHSDLESDEDLDDAGDLEELIGQEKDKAGDEAKRAKLHQQWLEKQDEQELAKLMDGVRNGFRRKRAGDLLLDDMGTDQDARKRRAMRGQDGSDEEYTGSEEDDRLAGLWQNVEEDDSDDAELTESAKKQLQHAAVLRKRSTEAGPSIDLDAGSQEILALLGSDSQGAHTRPAFAGAAPASRSLAATHTTSFMGRSFPVVSGARAASQVTSRSFVFGRGDSNSAAPPDDGTDNAVQGPTSFTDLDSMLGEPSKLGRAATGQTDSKRQYDRKPSLLGRLAGQQNLNSLRKISTNDLQGVLSSSFEPRFTGRKQSNRP